MILAHHRNWRTLRRKFVHVSTVIADIDQA